MIGCVLRSALEDNIDHFQLQQTFLTTAVARRRARKIKTFRD